MNVRVRVRVPERIKSESKSTEQVGRTENKPWHARGPLLACPRLTLAVFGVPWTRSCIVASGCWFIAVCFPGCWFSFVLPPPFLFSFLVFLRVLLPLVNIRPMQLHAHTRTQWKLPLPLDSPATLQSSLFLLSNVYYL
ncbi:MAG: hypothetical protein BYD32DRAFT_421205 [Podila humilis]|nr:MAG: hypothetical protein BYD32DRAFT_421205 [Podila humilis]